MKRTRLSEEQIAFALRQLDVVDVVILQSDCELALEVTPGLR